MGGGRKKFTPKGVDDPEGGDGGKRDDGKNLIETWINQKQYLGNASYVWHRNDLLNVDTASTDYLLGDVLLSRLSRPGMQLNGHCNADLSL